MLRDVSLGFRGHGDQRSDWLMTPEVSGRVSIMSNEKKITSI